MNFEATALIRVDLNFKGTCKFVYSSKLLEIFILFLTCYFNYDVGSYIIVVSTFYENKGCFRAHVMCILLVFTVL